MKTINLSEQKEEVFVLAPSARAVKQSADGYAFRTTSGIPYWVSYSSIYIAKVKNEDSSE